MRYIKGLDTIRAFAVICVILSHWLPPQTGFANSWLQTFSGGFGVYLFFVLSGFLISSILLLERDKFQNDPERKIGAIFKSFFMRRVLRIFPIYYLTLFIYAFFEPWVRQHFWYYFFYLGNIPPYVNNAPNPLSHTWSLAVEEQFYLLWPWIMLLVPDRFFKYVFSAAVILGLVSKLIVLYVWHHTYACLVINCFDAFGIGAIYAYVLRNNVLSRLFQQYLISALIVSLFFAYHFANHMGHPLGMTLSFAITDMVCVGIISVVINNRNPMFAKYFLENSWLNYLGKISYGLYLYHFVIGGLLEHLISIPFAFLHLHAGTVFYVFFMFGSKFIALVLIAGCSYALVESPFLKLKNKFTYSD